MQTPTIAPQTSVSKPPKAFFCHLYDEPGTLTKVDGTIYFMSPDTGRIIEFEPEMAPWCCVLGEVGLAETQRILDTLRGGLAAVACTRPI